MLEKAEQRVNSVGKADWIPRSAETKTASRYELEANKDGTQTRNAPNIETDKKVAK